jgi:hypothetical protein
MGHARYPCRVGYMDHATNLIGHATYQPIHLGEKSEPFCKKVVIRIKVEISQHVLFEAAHTE